MIVDTSALIAILKREAEEDQFTDLLLAESHPRISAATLVEVQLVAFGYGDKGELLELLNLFDLEVLAVDQHQATLAVAAFKKFGKGRHPAALNFGDCFSYAAAKAYDEPLLFKGNDFSKTDVKLA